MSRLLTLGAESQKAPTATATDDGEGEFMTSSGTVNFNTSVQKSGGACYSFPPSNVNRIDTSVWIGGNAQDFYMRIGFRMGNALPDAGTEFVHVRNTGKILSMHMNTGGQLGLLDQAGTLVGSRSSALSTATWYVCEVYWRQENSGNGKAGWRLYVPGTDTLTTIVANTTSVDLTNTTSTSIRFGNLNASNTACTWLLDDIAINIDGGSGTQSSWPGPTGKVVALWPTSDVTRDAGWLTSAGGTSNLFNDVDNRPPTGVAATPTTGETQVKNASASASSLYYAAGTDSYTDKGVPSTGATIQLVRGKFRGGGSSTTGTNNGLIRVSNNPDDGSDSTATAMFDTVVGADSGSNQGWQTFNTAFQEQPSVTLGNAGRLRVGKNSNSTRVAMVDQMFVEVEYTTWSVTLATAAATSTATLALTAPTQVPLATAAATSTATLALTAPAKVILETAAATSTATLSLTATTQIPLETAAATSTASLTLTAKTEIPLATAAAVSTTSLNLVAKTEIPLDTSAATSSTSLALTAPAIIALGTSSGTSSTSLSMSSTVAMETASAVSTASLSLTAPTQIPLGTSSGVSTTSASITATTGIPLDTSSASSSTSLTLSAPTIITLSSSDAVSTATLTNLSAKTIVVLGSSVAVSTTSITVSAPIIVTLGTSHGQSETFAHVSVPAAGSFNPHLVTQQITNSLETQVISKSLETVQTSHSVITEEIRRTTEVTPKVLHFDPPF